MPCRVVLCPLALMRLWMQKSRGFDSLISSLWGTYYSFNSEDEDDEEAEEASLRTVGRQSSCLSSEAFLLSHFFTLLNVAAAVAKFIVTNPIIIETGQDIVDSGFSDVVQRLFRQESLMRGNDYVWHGNQS